MGRELKRVALDFAWPIGQVWTGYINPFSKFSGRCTFCSGGYSAFAQRLHDQWYGNAVFDPVAYGSELFKETDESVMFMADRTARDYRHPENKPPIWKSEREARRLARLFNERWCHHLSQDDIDALVDDDRLYDFTHSRHIAEREGIDIQLMIKTRAYYLWLDAGSPEGRSAEFYEAATAEFDESSPMLPYPSGYRPTAKEVNHWSIIGFGHDSINASVCIRARCGRNQLHPYCLHCDGTATMWLSAEKKVAYDDWGPTEPPVGDAYQIWETVTEGSPISPPMSSPESLANWMANNSKGLDRLPYEAWLTFINGPGWAPSFMSVVDEDGNRKSGTGVEMLSGETN